jgi:hypothetical protein
VRGKGWCRMTELRNSHTRHTKATTLWVAPSACLLCFCVRGRCVECAAHSHFNCLACCVIDALYLPYRTVRAMHRSWAPAQGSSSGSSSQLSQGALAAAINIRVLAVALCAALAICCHKRKAGGDSGGKGGADKGSLLPRFLAGVGLVPDGSPPAGSGDKGSPSGSATSAKANTQGANGISSSSNKMLVLDGSSSTVGSDRSSSESGEPLVMERAAQLCDLQQRQQVQDPIRLQRPHCTGG